MWDRWGVELEDSELRRVRDGQTLHTLASGMEISRRVKHEPIREMERLSPEELERKTNKENGSKFLPHITLRHIVEMTARVLDENGATPQRDATYHKAFKKPIGISKGRDVRGLLVVCSGRYAHAFPIDETS